jgi:hypothetical protein
MPGRNGSKSNGHAPAGHAVEAVVPKFKKGDHARRLPAGPSGVVVRTDRYRALMHWGTQAARDSHGNQIEHRYEEWVPKAELEPVAVVSPDEVTKRQKQ